MVWGVLTMHKSVVFPQVPQLVGFRWLLSPCFCPIWRSAQDIICPFKIPHMLRLWKLSFLGEEETPLGSVGGLVRPKKYTDSISPS